MPKTAAIAAAFGCLWLAPPRAAAQSFESIGTRAQGMGGAFVAVADDATAVYWNPAGLALNGTSLSMVIDGSEGKATPDELDRAGRRSGSIVAFGTPPLGLWYYRLSATSLTPGGTPLDTSRIHLQRLVTHHAGITLVQSLTSHRSPVHVAVGTSLKLVRGIAADGLVAERGTRDDLLEDAGNLPDVASTKFDTDIGVLAQFSTLRVGVTARNLREAEFKTAGANSLELKRQTRAGMAYVGVDGLILSADIDLERAAGSLGEVRNFAAGAEAHILPRAFVRGGLRFNTLSDQPGGHAAVFSVGGGFATFRSLIIDAHATLGSDTGDRGWGVAARLVY